MQWLKLSWIDRTEVSGVTEHLRIFTGRLLLLYSLPTPERWKSHTPGGQSEGTEGPKAVDHLGITGAFTGCQFAPHSTAFKGLEFIPIRVGFNSQYLRRHDTKHPLPIWPHSAGRGPWQISALQSTCLSLGRSNQRVNPIQYLSPWLSQINGPGEANPLN